MDKAPVRPEVQCKQIPAIDELTGLANYQGLSETVKSEIKRSKRSGRDFATIVFDLNRIKQIKARNGNLKSDRALCRLAHIFRFSCRIVDTVARYDDDKFAIILLQSGAKGADIVERRICDRLSMDCEEPRLSVSAGFAVYPRDGQTHDALFEAAIRALQKVKEHAVDGPSPSRHSPIVISKQTIFLTSTRSRFFDLSER